MNSVDPAARSEKEKTVDLRLDAIATLERRAGAARLTTTAAGPAWAWPAIVAKLLACPAGDELRALARRLAQFSTAGGVRSIAFSGPGRCAGRTSLLLTLAQVLTELPSTRVAIVDADFGNPRAAAMLSVFPEAGLFEAASQAASHGSTVTTLMPGKLAIVPLIKRVAVDALDRGKIEAIQNFLRSLRHAYDVVLLDAGPWESLIPPLVFEGRAVDALICVSRASAAHVEQLDDDSYCQPGVEWLGVIETFAQS